MDPIRIQSIRRFTVVLDRPSTVDNSKALHEVRRVFDLDELCVDVNQTILRGYDGSLYETNVAMIAASIERLWKLRLTAVKGIHTERTLREAMKRLKQRIVCMPGGMRAVAARR